MTRKTDRLVKDLAALFVKYSLQDWQPIIDGLQRSEQYKTLSNAIRCELQGVQGQRSDSRRKKIVSKGKTSSFTRTKVPIPPDLRILHEALSEKKILPGMRDLRLAAESIGIKESLSVDRKEAIDFVLNRLSSLMPEIRAAAVTKLLNIGDQTASDQGREFERWAALIMNPKNVS